MYCKKKKVKYYRFADSFPIEQAFTSNMWKQHYHRLSFKIVFENTSHLTVHVANLCTHILYVFLEEDFFKPAKYLQKGE